MDKSIKTCYNCDWFSLFLKLKSFNKSNKYKYELQNYNTRIFSEVIIIKNETEELATITQKPFSSILQPNDAIIKFANSVLYMKNNAETIKSVIEAINAEIISISRIDICVDFQEFIEYKNPETLIIKYLTKEIEKKQRCNFSLNGYQSTGKHYNGITFGSKSSDIYWKMYNKSQEMRDKETKNYIVKCWEKADFDMKKDVWRIELSINGEKRKIIDKQTGEWIEANSLKALDKNTMTTLFENQKKKSFVFIKPITNKRKDRCEQVKLLPDEKNFITLEKFPFKKTTGTKDKIRINKLIDNYEIVKEFDEDTAEIVINSARIDAGHHQLTDYLEKRLKTIDMRPINERKLSSYAIQQPCPF